MTIAETLKVLAVLKVAYPAMDSRLTDEEYTAMVGLWAEMFADESYEVVGAAVKAFIATDEQGYPPTIGKIKAQISKLTPSSNQMTEAEAVGIIMQATRNSLYNCGEEFEKLPPILQRLVGHPRQLREWAASDSQTINTVVASNLQRSYRILQERQKDLEALPESIKRHMRLAATSSMHLIE